MVLDTYFFFQFNVHLTDFSSFFFTSSQVSQSCTWWKSCLYPYTFRYPLSTRLNLFYPIFHYNDILTYIFFLLFLLKVATVLHLYTYLLDAEFNKRREVSLDIYTFVWTCTCTWHSYIYIHFIIHICQYTNSILLYNWLELFSINQNLYLKKTPEWPKKKANEKKSIVWNGNKKYLYIF